MAHQIAVIGGDGIALLLAGLAVIIAAGDLIPLRRQHLLRSVWGNGYSEDIGVLRVNISNLRKKLEAGLSGRRFILTEPGVGYRLTTA